MTIQATIARENAISVEAKLTGHAKRADGGLNLRFMIHPHDIPQQLRDAPIGTRYIVALVEIGDDEQPVVRVEGDAPVPSTLAAKASTSASASSRGEPSSDIQPRAQNRYSQRAGILCNDPVFHRFLRECRRYTISNSSDAAAVVRHICLVKTRADILSDTDAALAFDLLESAFVAWRDKDKYVEDVA